MTCFYEQKIQQALEDLRTKKIRLSQLLARAREGYTAVIQATVTQLAVCATKMASSTLPTVIGPLTSVLTEQQARATPRVVIE